jgi:hypothetical protein
VVHGQSRLAHAATRGLCGTLHARATHSLIGATIVIGCSLLVALLVPLLVGLGSLLGSLDDDIRRRCPAAAYPLAASCLSPVKVHGKSSAPLWAGFMMTVPEPSLLRERLKPLNWSVMNLRFPKRMVAPREKPSHNKRSLPAATASANDGTIRTSRGKPHCKSPFLVCQLLVFFCTGKI